MKDYLQFMWYAVVVIFTISILAFIGNTLGLFSFAFFAPKVEAVRYKTFQESQTYNEGMLRDLQNLKLQYLTANQDQQAALKAIVVQRFSVYPIDRLPADLQAFYLSLNQGAMK